MKDCPAYKHKALENHPRGGTGTASGLGRAHVPGSANGWLCDLGQVTLPLWLSTPFCKVSGLGDRSHEPKYLLKKKGKHSILHSSTYLVYYGFCFKARICLYTPGLSQEPLGGLG